MVATNRRTLFCEHRFGLQPLVRVSPSLARQVVARLVRDTQRTKRQINDRGLAAVRPTRRRRRPD